MTAHWRQIRRSTVDSEADTIAVSSPTLAIDKALPFTRERSKSSPYQEYVRDLAELNPTISNLQRFLEGIEAPQHQRPCRIAVLDYVDENDVPRLRHIQSIEQLELELEDYDLGGIPYNAYGRPGEHYGRLLMVEDLTREVLEILGSHLDIDPLFFSSHIHTPWVDSGEQDTDISILPSRSRPQKFINIHHQRTLAFQASEQPPKKLLRDSNVTRKVIVLPPLKKVKVALAQHCISVYKAPPSKRGWLGLVLVDAPLSELYRTDSAHEAFDAMQLSLKPFGGGFGDFIGAPSISDDLDRRRGPRRDGLFDTLIYYWQRHDAGGIGLEEPTMLQLAEYPLRIVASEWTIYYQVMRYSIKQYEYAPGGTNKLLIELEKLNDDLRGLQSWRRRALSSGHKISAVSRFLKHHRRAAKDDGLRMSLTEDFDYVIANINECSRLLEGMLPVVTSLVQIVDSRRSVAETANISRLTILALVFVPLTFVASLFSMNSNFGPDGENFWQYFAVAIPMTLVVFVFAQPPRTLVKAIGRYVRARLSGGQRALDRV